MPKSRKRATKAQRQRRRPVGPQAGGNQPPKPEGAASRGVATIRESVWAAGHQPVAGRGGVLVAPARQDRQEPAASVPSADGDPSGGNAAARLIAQTTTGCSLLAEAADVMPGLAVSYVFDAAALGPIGPAVIDVHFVGIHCGSERNEKAPDRFVQMETVRGITAASGRVSVTAKVDHLPAGEWNITATPKVRSLQPTGRRNAPVVALPARVQTAKTTLAPMVHGIGVRPYAWPALVLLGVILAVSLQAVVADSRGLNVTVTTVAAIAGALVGYLAAKTYYLVLHRMGPRHFLQAGTCIQGFLVGAFITAAVIVVANGLSVAAFVDAAVPGVFLAMGIARPGCLLGGCCAGRPTTSRWGLWSSNRRVGIRRIPTQLIEGAAAIVIGAGALGTMLAARPSPDGVVFLAAISAYTVIRQLLFPLRDEPRKTAAGRVVTLAVATATLALSLLLLLGAGWLFRSH